MLYKNGKDSNYLDELVEEAETIEQLLLKVSNLLDSCQPNRPGRIRLYFWHAHGKERDTDPIFVRQAKKDPDPLAKIKFPERLPEINLSRRALSKGVFERNYEFTKATLLLASKILKRRKAVRDSINKIGLIARGTLNGNYKESLTDEKNLIAIDSMIYQRLKDDTFEDMHCDIGPVIFSENLPKI
jgi:hypothetical protein